MAAFINFGQFNKVFRQSVLLGHRSAKKALGQVIPLGITASQSGCGHHLRFFSSGSDCILKALFSRRIIAGFQMERSKIQQNPGIVRRESPGAFHDLDALLKIAAPKRLSHAFQDSLQITFGRHPLWLGIHYGYRIHPTRFAPSNTYVGSGKIP